MANCDCRDGATERFARVDLKDFIRALSNWKNCLHADGLCPLNGDKMPWS